MTLGIDEPDFHAWRSISVGPNLGPKLPETNLRRIGLLGTVRSREANNSVRFRTAYNVRGRAYAISKTGGCRFESCHSCQLPKII